MCVCVLDYLLASAHWSLYSSPSIEAGNGILNDAGWVAVVVVGPSSSAASVFLSFIWYHAAAYFLQSQANYVHFCGAVSCLGACLEIGTIEALTTCKQHTWWDGMGLRSYVNGSIKHIKPASSVVCNHLLVFVPSNSFAKACSNQGTSVTCVI